MTARLLPFPTRPWPRTRPGRRPAPAAGEDGPVLVEWDDARGLYTAICGRCTDTMTAVLADHAHDWADTHHCDPELAALLTDITGGTAA